MLIYILIYLAAASLAGLITGLLGGGIGLVLVPMLVWILKAQHVVANHIIMHVAIGTTVAALTVMGSVGSYSYYKKKSVDWPSLRKMVFSLVIGLVIGAMLANKISSDVLIFIFAIVVLLLAVYIWFGKDKVVVQKVKTSFIVFQLVALVIGFVGSVLGISPIAVPFFKKIGLNIRIAIGTGLVIGTIMAFGILVMYTITGFGVVGVPEYCIGYVNWPFAIPIAIVSSFFIPLGTKIADRVPQSFLRFLYGLLLVIVGGNMIISICF